jgi:hypothetical protein
MTVTVIPMLDCTHRIVPARRVASVIFFIPISNIAALEG